MRGKYAVKQISVFLENRCGRLTDVSKALLDENINIRALVLADSSEFGILRMVVDNPEKAKAMLLAKSFAASETDVFAVEVEDKPGGLYSVVKVLSDNGISVEYVYAYAGSSREAILFFKVKDEDFDRSVKLLLDRNIKVIEAVEFYE